MGDDVEPAFLARHVPQSNDSLADFVIGVLVFDLEDGTVNGAEGRKVRLDLDYLGPSSHRGRACDHKPKCNQHTVTQYLNSRLLEPFYSTG